MENNIIGSHISTKIVTVYKVSSVVNRTPMKDKSNILYDIEIVDIVKLNHKNIDNGMKVLEQIRLLFTDYNLTNKHRDRLTFNKEDQLICYVAYDPDSNSPLFLDVDYTLLKARLTKYFANKYDVKTKLYGTAIKHRKKPGRKKKKFKVFGKNYELLDTIKKSIMSSFDMKVTNTTAIKFNVDAELNKFINTLKDNGIYFEKYSLSKDVYYTIDTIAELYQLENKCEVNTDNHDNKDDAGDL